jgi:hypothetical protein
MRTRHLYRILTGPSFAGHRLKWETNRKKEGETIGKKRSPVVLANGNICS